MKYVTFLALLLLFSACNQQKTNHTQKLQNEIDSLQTALSNTYKPGFGEFMSNIQMHHMKLWFAGKNENWKLADFEINELKENFEAIPKYCADRPESGLVGIIDQPLKDVSKAVQQENLAQFKQSFNVLTTICVSCHKATKHNFIRIQIPDENIFKNQVFDLRNNNATENN